MKSLVGGTGRFERAKKRLREGYRRNGYLSSTQETVIPPLRMIMELLGQQHVQKSPTLNSPTQMSAKRSNEPKQLVAGGVR